jgi:hypothetical protein
MGCLLHLLCESAMPNIQMQKTGKGVTGQSNEFLSASDLERSKGCLSASKSDGLQLHQKPLLKVFHGVRNELVFLVRPT